MSSSDKIATIKKGATIGRKNSLTRPPLQISDDQRIYKTSTFGEYTSPKLKTAATTTTKEADTPIKSEKRFPVFIGPNGTFYDINYLPIEQPALANGTTPSTPDSTSPSSSTNALHFDTSVLVNSFPSPEQFESYFDYEQSLLDWKMTVEGELSGLRLPNVMGRKFYRPRVVDYQTAELTASMEAELEDDIKSDATGAPAEGEEAATEKKEKTEDEEEAPKPKPPQVLDVDPWDVQLVPMEPLPFDYDSFQEYEEALIKWAHLCSTLQVLPPHASQLKDMINIRAPTSTEDKVDIPITADSQKNEPEMKWKVRPGFKEPCFFETNFIPNRHNNWNTSPVVAANLPPITQFRHLAHPVKVQKFIADLLQAQNEKLDKYGRYSKPLLPVIHGTFPKPWEQARNSSGNANKITIRNSKYRTLRRTDLTGPMISSCMDSPGEIEGTKVDFNTPEFDIDNIDIQRLSTDHAYLDQITKSVVYLQHYDRNDYLNSWFHPHVPQDVHNKHREYINYLIMSTPANKFEVGALCEILSGDMFLDKFQDLLGETCREEEDGSAKSYLQLFIGCVTPENFPSVLALFENGNSPLLHAKLSAFVSETAQSAKGKTLLERLIVTKDIKSLSFVAYAITYFSEVPVDVFPWHTDSYYSVKRFLGKAVEPLLIIFCYYYVTIICQTINKQPFLFVGLSYFINDARKNLGTQLGQVLQQYPEFITKYVFQGIASRLQTISQTFLFVMVQLLTQQNLDSPLVQVCLRSEETDVINRIKELTDSKYLHVQLAARRLFAIISNEPWQDFLFAEYSNNPDLFLNDLIHNLNPLRQSLLSGLTLDMTVAALDKVTTADASKKRLAFAMDESLFHTLIQSILRTKQVDATHVTISALLAQLAKTYYRLGLITPTLNVKTSQKRTGNLSLTLSPLDLQKMLTQITDVQGIDPTITNAVRKNLLMMYRRLLKTSLIFEFVRKENDFYSRLQAFCREGALHQLEFNKEAWKMLYQIVYRHQGVMDHMIKNNLMHPILETIGTFSPNVVVMNGLRSITKMFSMVEQEQRQPKRKDIKTVEKDIKSLNSLFMNRRLFIKIHMIYRKFIPYIPGTTIPTLTSTPGAAFSALANFYYTLQTAPGCGKLLKDTLKTAEYKDGLQHINAMFTTPILFEETSGSPNPGVKPKKESKKLGGFLSRTSSITG